MVTELVVACLAFAAVLMVPGALVLHSARFPAWLAWGASPAITSLIVFVSAEIAPRVGLRWSILPVALLTAVLSAAAWLITLPLRSRSRPLTPPRVAPWQAIPHKLVQGWKTQRWLIITIAGATVLVVVPMVVGMGSPSAPLQQWDAVFHLNGVADISDSGDASNLAGLYGSGASTYYPAVWHGLVALVVDLLGPITSQSIPVAANASTLVIGTVPWLWGLATFARVCFPGRRDVALLTVAFAPAFMVFPTYQLSVLAQWPNGLSVMMLPGVCALAVATARFCTPAAWWHGDLGRVSWHWLPRRRVWGALLLVGVTGGAVLGASVAHGSAFFALLVLLVPGAAALVISAGRYTWRQGHRVRAVGSLTAIVGATALVCVTVLNLPSIQSLMRYERAPIRSYWESAVHTVFDTEITGGPGNLVVTGLVVLGAVACWRLRSHRWLVGSAVVVIVMVAFAGGPDNPLRMLTGAWYKQPARIEAIYPIVASLLAAWGARAFLTWLQRWARRRRSLTVIPSHVRRLRLSRRHLTIAVVLVAVVTSGGYQASSRARTFAQAYDPDQIRWGTMLTAAELEVVRTFPDILPADAVVIGQPYSGAPFAWSIGQRHVVFPQLSASGADAHQVFLRAHFRDIHTDPAVCQALKAVGATYFYDDRATPADGAKPNADAPGFNDVDVTTGFERVAGAGTMTLYRITACDG